MVGSLCRRQATPGGMSCGGPASDPRQPVSGQNLDLPFGVGVYGIPCHRSVNPEPMLETDSLTPCRVPSDLLEDVRALYDRGLYLQAYRAAQPLGPLREWPGTGGLVLAGRLANNLG